MSTTTVRRTGGSPAAQSKPGARRLKRPRPAKIAPVWPLTGRDAELRAVADLLDSVPDHPGVVLAGPPGVGKTRLAQEAVAIAGRRGATAYWATATSSAASIPLGALSHLLPPLHPPSDSAGLQTLHHATEAIRDLGGSRPLVLVVDDAHLLDDASATLLHQVALNGVASLVVTLRSAEPAPDPVVALWKDQIVPRLDLAPLSRAGMAELVSVVLGGRTDSEAAARLWRLALGNPLFLREIVLGALESGQLVVQSGIWSWQGAFSPTARLTELVRAPLSRLPPAPRALVETVAIGEPLSAGLTTRLSCEETLRSAEEAGVITLERDGRRWLVRMAHPLYGEVVRAECSPARARDARRALVALQGAIGLRRRGDLLRQATWQLDADGTGEAGLLAVAAGQAVIVDPKVAERMARAALSSGGGVPAQLALGMALRCQGHTRRAEAEVARAAAMASTDDQRAESALVLAQILFGDHGAVKQAEAVLEDAQATAGGAGTADSITALRGTFAVFTGRPRAAIQIVSPLLSSPSASVDAIVRASAVQSHALARCGRLAEALAATERGHRVMHGNDSHAGCRGPAHPDFTTVLAHTETTATRLAGRLHDAEDQASTFYDRWAERPGEGRMPVARLLLGEAALARGRAATAAHHLQLVVGDLTARAKGPWLYWALLSLTEALALTGDTEAAQTTLNTATRERRATLRLWDPDLMLAEAAVLGSSGEVTRAAARAAEAASDAAATGQSSIEAVALHASVRLGRCESSVADRLCQLAQEVDSALVATLSIHAVALVAQDGAGLDRASAEFSAMGADLAAAEAAGHAAAAHRRAGRRASELASSRRARELASACEGACVPALEHMADEVFLTPREREIAGLAARGKSNRAIAEGLVVSVRTVENHLDRVYAKLGLHSRRELAVALGRSVGSLAN